MSISCLIPCSNSSAGPTTSPLVIIRTLQQADHSNFQLHNYLTSEINILNFFSGKKKYQRQTSSSRPKQNKLDDSGCLPLSGLTINNGNWG
jgi:hypothetical protein